MNGTIKMNALFDSNILIDFLNKREESKVEIEHYKNRHISIITYIEVLCGPKTPQDEIVTNSFLKFFKIIHINTNIAIAAVNLRKNFKLKLPDALIIATSIEENMLLITRDKKDMYSKFSNIKIPYTI